MTRAPLPGKLPEWPEKPPQWIGGTFAVYQAECIAYWESRARLAVEALITIRTIIRERGPSSNASDKEYGLAKAWSEAGEALDAIGPFPEEDRT